MSLRSEVAGDVVRVSAVADDALGSDDAVGLASRLRRGEVSVREVRRGGGGAGGAGRPDAAGALSRSVRRSRDRECRRASGGGAGAGQGEHRRRGLADDERELGLRRRTGSGALRGDEAAARPGVGAGRELADAGVRAERQHRVRRRRSPPATHGTRRCPPVPPPAGPPRSSPPAPSRSPTPTTAAGRSASRPPRAGSSGSSRRGGGPRSTPRAADADQPGQRRRRHPLRPRHRRRPRRDSTAAVVTPPSRRSASSTGPGRDDCGSASSSRARPPAPSTRRPAPPSSPPRRCSSARATSSSRTPSASGSSSSTTSSCTGACSPFGIVAGGRFGFPQFDAPRLDPLTHGLHRHFLTTAPRRPGFLRRLKRVARIRRRVRPPRRPALAGPRAPHAGVGRLHPSVPFDELRQRLVNYVGFTPLQNVAGAPAIALPGGTTADGLPVGVQLASARGDERTLLELAYILEAERPWRLL